jgi:hypothetical protein
MPQKVKFWKKGNSATLGKSMRRQKPASGQSDHSSKQYKVDVAFLYLGTLILKGL